MIITIARQCGSGGHEIGKELASRLGLELYDRKKLEEEAKKLGKLDENKEFFQEKAAKLIKEVDEKKASFHKFCTGKEWEDASQYQLSIDTGKLGISDVADMIINYINAKNIGQKHL